MVNLLDVVVVVLEVDVELEVDVVLGVDVVVVLEVAVVVPEVVESSTEVDVVVQEEAEVHREVFQVEVVYVVVQDQEVFQIEVVLVQEVHQEETCQEEIRQEAMYLYNKNHHQYLNSQQSTQKQLLKSNKSLNR